MKIEKILSSQLSHFDYKSIEDLCLIQIELHSQNLLYLYYYTTVCITQSRFKKAKIVIEKHKNLLIPLCSPLKDEKNFRGIFYNYSFCLYRLQEYESAESNLLNLSSYLELNSFELLLLGKIKKVRQEIEESKKLFLKSLSLNPTSFSTIKVISKCQIDISQYLRINNKEKGKKNLLEIEEIENKEVVLDCIFAYSLVLSYSFKKAIEVLDRLLLREYILSFLERLRAYSYSEVNDIPEAVFIFSESFERHEYNLDYIDHYSTLLWKQLAIKKLNKLKESVAEVDENSKEYHIVVGNKLSLESKTEEAIKQFETATKIDFEDVTSLNLTAFEYMALGRNDEVLVILSESLNLDIHSYRTWMGLGLLYQKLNKLDNSLTYTKKAFELNENDSQVVCLLASLYSRQGKIEEGVEALEKYLDTYTQNIPVMTKLADLYFKQRNIDKGIDLCKDLILMKPANVEGYIKLGKFYMLKNDICSAKQNFFIALKHAGDDDKAINAIKNLINNS